MTAPWTPEPKDFDGVYVKAAPYCRYCHRLTRTQYENRCLDCGEPKALIPGVA